MKKPLVTEVHVWKLKSIEDHVDVFGDSGEGMSDRLGTLYTAPGRGAELAKRLFVDDEKSGSIETKISEDMTIWKCARRDEDGR